MGGGLKFKVDSVSLKGDVGDMVTTNSFGYQRLMQNRKYDIFCHLARHLVELTAKNICRPSSEG